MLEHTYNLSTWEKQVDLSEFKFRLSSRKARADPPPKKTKNKQTNKQKQQTTLEDDLKAGLSCCTECLQL